MIDGFDFGLAKAMGISGMGKTRLWLITTGNIHDFKSTWSHYIAEFDEVG